MGRPRAWWTPGLGSLRLLHPLAAPVCLPPVPTLPGGADDPALLTRSVDLFLVRHKSPLILIRSAMPRPRTRRSTTSGPSTNTATPLSADPCLGESSATETPTSLASSSRSPKSPSLSRSWPAYSSSSLTFSSLWWNVNSTTSSLPHESTSESSPCAVCRPPPVRPKYPLPATPGFGGATLPESRPPPPWSPRSSSSLPNPATQPLPIPCAV